MLVPAQLISRELGFVFDLNARTPPSQRQSSCRCYNSLAEEQPMEQRVSIVTLGVADLKRSREF
jgi:hypothetical protein